MIDGTRRSRGNPRAARTASPAQPRPLDASKLQALALHYAARYSTTAGKLRTYLQRKLRERPWEGSVEPDPEALIERLVALGYVDDAAWASAKRRTMASRGLGSRRVTQALSAAGIAPEDAAAGQTDEDDASDATMATALRFARRKRLGPFARADSASDPAAEHRALAAMLRAGHDFTTARRVLAARTVAEAEALAAPAKS